MAETTEQDIKPGPDAKDITPNQDGGVLKEIITEGEGDLTPTNGNKVKVHYEGRFTDGSIFDSSKERSPFSFVLGKGNVIRAWDVGVATMRKNEVCRLFCRGDYAYGESGSPPKIPPNATLVFEITMLDWEAEDLSSKKDQGIMRSQIKAGDGKSGPKEGSNVDIQLKGEHEGRVFDERNISFCLGEGIDENIPPGLERAIEKFSLNETSVIELKPQYGFGAEGNKEFGIPPDASLKYTVTLTGFTKVKDCWMMENQEKIDQGVIYKEKGTKYFKAEKYEQAVKMYKKVLEYLESGQDYDEPLQEQRKSLLVAANLNISMCYLKLGKYFPAKSKCDAAIQSDPKSVKAYFRRGQALLGMNDPEAAKVDFETAYQLDPTNKAALSQISVCTTKIKEIRAKEKTLYSNMFEQYSKKKEWRYGWWDKNHVEVERISDHLEEDLVEARKKDIESKKKFLEKAKIMRDERERILAEEVKEKTEGTDEQEGTTEETEKGKTEGPNEQQGIIEGPEKGEIEGPNEKQGSTEEVPSKEEAQPTIGDKPPEQT